MSRIEPVSVEVIAEAPEVVPGEYVVLDSCQPLANNGVVLDGKSGVDGNLSGRPLPLRTSGIGTSPEGSIEPDVIQQQQECGETSAGVRAGKQSHMETSRLTGKSCSNAPEVKLLLNFIPLL
jgi:hypothetical protein